MKKIMIIAFTIYSISVQAQDYSFVPDSLKLISQEELFKKPPPRHMDLVYYEDGTKTTWKEVLPLIMSQKVSPKMYVDSQGNYQLLVAVKIKESDQEENLKPPFETRMADLGEIKLEYFDYGGDGPTLILLQDFHNYYSGPRKKKLSDPYFSFAKSLTKEFRVLSPLRRGYGNSTDSQWGFDVATLSLDIIDFMDALNIEKAFLYARVPANQEITWIAEYYPERLHGLIYEGNPVITVNCMDKEVLEFSNNIQMFGLDGFDRDKARQVYLSRSMWRPRFLKNEDIRIDVPAIRFTIPEQKGSTPNLAFGSKESIEGILLRPVEDREEEIEYLKTLIQDSIRYEKLYTKLQKCNLGDAMEESMKRAFSDKLITKPMPDEFKERSMESYKGFKNWQREAIFQFKQKVIK